ncbi:PRC-barrel domain-containing protein [Massilia glaciei]|uniref:PRC-barrel domain containing protein n=1 Tax=Massilia glaciei TaxID=1524097 RepID=A0A2U2HLV3_9BURK|nr:PRC-barrel domain-containing protein [Massilia glaciei]PWF48473.1 PRC-barrel domain containing protein [Massilia glaciei]
MLHSAKELKGLDIVATDGEFGTIDDLYFDDDHWTIRYLVVDTGGWLSGRDVLIPINALLGGDWRNEKIRVGLTKKQIEDSPGIDTDAPVSRQQETSVYQHYGYPYYWAGPYAWGEMVFPIALGEATTPDPDMRCGETGIAQDKPPGDPHLRSVKEVAGYKIQATDDSVGHVEDFLIDDRDWSIQLMVVDTKNWLPGKDVLISPRRIDHVSWDEQKVSVNVSRAVIENSPEYEPANAPPFGPKYDLYRRFGTPHG